MTDDTTPVLNRRTIEEIANLAVSDPTKLTSPEVTRLGDWILDHEAHVMAHGRLAALSAQNFGPPTQADRQASRAARIAREEQTRPGELAKPAETPAMEPVP